MNDIVERLRQSHQYSGIQCKGCLAGADEIERLRAINAELLEALRDIMQVITDNDLISESVSYMRLARAAIAKAEAKS